MSSQPNTTSELATLFDAYRTCELVTVSKSGVPIAWPTVALHQPESGTFLISTSLGYPQKAHNIRRSPRVALLFSDPTGSGLDAPPQVLVQGTATCPEQIETGFAAHRALWTRLLTLQPSAKLYSSTALTRHLMDVYYMRLHITVTPDAIVSMPALSTSGTLTIPDSVADPIVAQAARRLRGYRSAVLAAFDGEGRPTLVRVVPEVRDGALVVPLPDGVQLDGGPASLLLHRHDKKIGAMHSMVLTGRIEPGVAGLGFHAERLVPGQSPVTPIVATRVIRELRGSAQRYLDARGLARPAIAWDELKAIKARLRTQR
jgi:general stress protein 26